MRSRLAPDGEISREVCSRTTARTGVASDPDQGGVTNQDPLALDGWPSVNSLVITRLGLRLCGGGVCANIHCKGAEHAELTREKTSSIGHSLISDFVLLAAIVCYHPFRSNQ